MRRPVMLAGGLHPGNVAEAIAVARPWGVDTSRGVESAPGVKDHELVAAFVRTAKEAAVTTTYPDERGRFGEFGGRFVPETVMGALDELAAGYAAARADPAFAADVERLGRDYVGRPTPLYLAERAGRGDGAPASASSART